MKIKYALALLLVFLLHVAANYWVLSNSQPAHIYDESGRIKNGAEICFLVEAHTPKFELAGSLLELDGGQAHPRLFEVVEAMSWKLLGGVDEKKIEQMIWIANSFFLWILLMSIYGIGSILYDKNVGLLAAFLTPLFSMVFGHSRMALLDYPLMCMVSLSFFLLLKTNGFSSLFYSCLFGVAFGLSELTKETAALASITKLMRASAATKRWRIKFPPQLAHRKLARSFDREA